MLNTLPSLEEMLEAGVHFGHPTRQWYPKMAPYIFGARDGIHVIDLVQTHAQLKGVCGLIEKESKRGAKIIFVGTKRQAAPVVKRIAEKAGVFYIVDRWPGGLITNFGSIRGAIKHYEEICKQVLDQEYLESLSTKQKFILLKNHERLGKMFAGLKGLDAIPQLLVIIDPKREKTAIQEARRHHTQTIGIVDTNTDPNLVDFPIVANDDALKSIELILGAIGGAIAKPTQEKTKEKRRQTKR